MNEGRSGLGWVLNVVVILILIWIGWQVSGLSNRVGLLEQRLVSIEQAIQKPPIKEEEPPPGPGPIITVEPHDSGGSVQAHWQIGLKDVVFGEPGYIREDAMGTGVNMFVAIPPKGSVQVVINKLTVPVKGHEVEVSRSGGLVWKVGGTTLQQCTIKTGGGGHPCQNDGLPPELAGELDATIQAVKEAGDTMVVGEATMQASE
jgi:hypothetical protein